MKNMIKGLGIFAAVVALNSSAMADDIYLGQAGYGGNGCPAGSASVTLSPDAKALSIIFDRYSAEAGGGNGKTIDRKSCNIAIPVHVPQGMSVSIIDVDYRGYVMAPVGGSANFRTEYFFAGSRGPAFEKNFVGPYDDEYTLKSTLALNAMVWSACGEDVNLRVNTAMVAKTNRRMDDVMATVDSADFKAGLIYHLQWKRCN